MPNIYINDTILPWCSEVKNLGVVIDNTLSWNSHVDSTCRKVFASMHSLKRLRALLPGSTRETLIKSLIMPHFDYCDFLLTNMTFKLQRKLQVAQNACVRFIFDLRKYDHVSEFFDRIRLLTLDKRRLLHSLLLLYKVLTGSHATRLISNFNPLKLNRARESALLCVPRHNTTSFSKSFTITAIRAWNKLPARLKHLNTFGKFKAELTTWVRNNGI